MKDKGLPFARSKEGERYFYEHKYLLEVLPETSYN